MYVIVDQFPHVHIANHFQHTSSILPLHVHEGCSTQMWRLAANVQRHTGRVPWDNTVDVITKANTLSFTQCCADLISSDSQCKHCWLKIPSMNWNVGQQQQRSVSAQVWTDLSLFSWETAISQSSMTFSFLLHSTSCMLESKQDPEIWAKGVRV